MCGFFVNLKFRLLYIELAMENNSDKLKIDYGGLGISVGSLLIALILGLSVSYYQDHEFPNCCTCIDDKQKAKINCCERLQKCIAFLGMLGLVIIVVGTLFNNMTSEYPFYEYDAKYWAGNLILTVNCFCVLFVNVLFVLRVARFNCFTSCTF